MDSQDTQKQEWHKPEIISLAGSASAGGDVRNNPSEQDKGPSNNENSQQANPGTS
jgi:hypothetical protein